MPDSEYRAVKPLTIDSVALCIEVRTALQRLLDEGDAVGAVALADSLLAGTGQESNVKRMRAGIYIDGGDQLDRIDLIEKGADILREFMSHNSAEILYNLGSAELASWQIAVRTSELGTAWLEHRCHLHGARQFFNRVAEDKSASVELRLRALTDCGNSYDIVGRYLDALDCYERALRIEPSFGMALGNRGITLLNMAPLMGEHESHLLQEAAADLDAAINNRESVLHNGGHSALDQFERQRASISGSAAPLRKGDPLRSFLGDPYLDWCLSNELFLHVSPGCIRHETKTLDPVFFRYLRLGLSDEELRHTDEIVDAFNAVKQAYISGRYLVWLARSDESPVREHTRAITRRTSFLDTLSYARWGARTGIAVQAYKAAVDLLDKIAAYVHLYFDSGRNPRDVSFRSLPFAPKSRNELAEPFANALKRPEQNRGLITLIDLSSELDERSREMFQRRNAATHRFLVVHTEIPPDPSKWTEHVGWSDLMKESVHGLRLARHSIVYLAQMIDIHEGPLRQANSSSGLDMPWPIPRTDTDLMEAE